MIKNFVSIIIIFKENNESGINNKERKITSFRAKQLVLKYEYCLEHYLG